MKIVLVDYYKPIVESKTTLQTVHGLREIGVTAELIPMNPQDAPEVCLFDMKTKDLHSPDFWSRVGADVVILVSRLSKNYLPIINAIRKSGSRILIKADSDGTLGYPLVPNYLRALRVFPNPFLWVARNIKWRFLSKKIVQYKIKQIDICEGLIIESPQALENIKHILRYFSREDLCKKVSFVPDPVAPDIFSELPLNKKQQIVAIGRWEDSTVKNTDNMIKSLILFLTENTSYRAVIIGSGKELLLSRLKKVPQNIKIRIDIPGTLPHQEVATTLLSSRIVLMPSNLESFGLAAAEGLCAGCSVVVTPIESLIYFSDTGCSGTVAKGFSMKAILDALTQDALKWEAGQYDPNAIAKRWRDELNRKHVANKIMAIIQDKQIA